MTGGAIKGVEVSGAAAPAVAVSVAGATNKLVDIVVGASVVEDELPGMQLLSPSNAANNTVMIRMDKCGFIKRFLLEDNAGGGQQIQEYKKTPSDTSTRESRWSTFHCCLPLLKRENRGADRGSLSKGGEEKSPYCANFSTRSSTLLDGECTIALLLFDAPSPKYGK